MEIHEQPQYDPDQSRHESISIERNSKGVNVKVRTVRSERETQTAWLQRTLGLYGDVRREVDYPELAGMMSIVKKEQG